MEPTREAKARQTKEHMVKIHRAEGKAVHVTWTQMETGDMLSDGTHNGSEGQAYQRKEHMVRGRGEGSTDDLDPDGDRGPAF
jgi:hypothetical protein